jgi:hypothetical protein
VVVPGWENLHAIASEAERDESFPNRSCPTNPSRSE